MDSNCDRCGAEFVKTEYTTGYGEDPETGKRLCFMCCGVLDSERMAVEKKYTLYLTRDKETGHAVVTNWPGTLSLRAYTDRKEHGHNWGLSRTDVWFEDAHGNGWHGVHYGDNTQLCHCKKLKGA